MTDVLSKAENELRQGEVAVALPEHSDAGLYFIGAIRQRSSTTIEHTGPSRLPRLGHSWRVRQGVWIVPIK